MAQFLGYMLFSGLEYFSLVMIILCMFRFKLKYFIKEMIITTIVLTFISYILLIINMTPLIMPINIIVMVVIFRYFFDVSTRKAAKSFWMTIIEKWAYSLWITFSGTIAFAILQTAIVMISIQSGAITAADTTQSFGFIVYIHQALTATIVTSIAAWIKYTNSGFGFNFRTSFSKPLYTMIAILSVTVWSAFFFMYATTEDHIFFYLLLSSVVSLFIVSLRLSYLKEQEEFSFG